MLNNLLQMHLKLFQKKAIQKTAEAIANLTGNKTAAKLQGRCNTEDVEFESMEVARERYISPVKRQQIIDEIRLK